MNSNNFTIRNMTADELEQIAVDWASKEGWNPGLYDAPCFYQSDPKGFLVGLLKDEPIACISVVAYNRGFAFLGFYIVKPEYRGQGYGLQLWNKALRYLSTQNIGLDGVVAQQANYAKSGFQTAYNNIRFQGLAKSAHANSDNIVSHAAVSLERLIDYDAGMFPSPRPAFLKCWLNQPESTSLVALEQGNIAGYGMIRKCREGYKLGPLFANTPDFAESLFLALNNAVEPGSTIYLDTPDINPAAVQIAKKYEMSRVFETARMYTKYQPDIDIKKVFGVTTFELG